jgi:3-phosphoglycerate kinase
MAAYRTLDDLHDVKGKRVLVRADLNVPMKTASSPTRCGSSVRRRRSRSWPSAARA